MSLDFNPQKKSARNLVISPNIQLAAGNIFADAALTRRQRFDGAAVMEQTPTRAGDKDMSGKGTEFATDSQLTNWDSKFSCKADLDDFIAGWALALVMGAEDVSGADAPYLHSITFDESSAGTHAPMTNVYLEDTEDVKSKYCDMSATDVTLSLSAKGRAGIEIAMAGTGRWRDEAMAALPALAEYAYLMNSDTVFELGPFGGALASMVGRFMSATLKISSGTVSHVAPGGQQFGIFMRTGLRKFSLQATIAAKETDDVRTLLVNDTMCQLAMTTTSGVLPSILGISIPKFKMKTHKIGVDGSMVIWQVEIDETTALKVVGDAPVDALSVTVQNSVPAYLVGVAGESSSSSGASSSSSGGSSSSSSA